MPGMPSQNLDPSNAHLKAAGQRLQDARLAQDISVDTVMRELRVTRLQIAGIESGNPKSFYNENFFIDLLKRYARLLNFSESAIAKMVSPPVIEVVKSAESEVQMAPLAGSADDAAPAKSEAVESPGDTSAAVQTPVAEMQADNDLVTATDPVHPTPLDDRPTQTKSGSRMVGLLALLVLVGGGVAVGLQMTASTDQPAVTKASTTVTPAAAPPDGAAVPPNASGVPNAAGADLVKSESSGVPVSAQTAVTPAKAAPAPVAAPAAGAGKPAETKPSQAEASEATKTDDAQAANKTIVDTPMTLTAKQKSWIWVRDASDQVRQFGVSQGQTVKFDQLPIYIVVHDPTVFEVIIGNKVVPLVRNNEERNVARHTRTDLINFYKQ